MSRRLLGLFFAGTLWAAVWGQQSPQKPTQQVPPEEDETLKAPNEYTFNPLQASKEVQIGRFYMKKGNYNAAALRFEEATRWDGTNADAYLLLGEAREKQKDRAGASEAYAKYLQLATDAKNAKGIRKKLVVKGKAKPHK